MTRKKFVKQLMAVGYDRNGAEAAARACVNLGATYEQALEWAKIGYRSRSYLDELRANLAKVVQPAVEAMAEIVRKFTAAVSTIDWEAVGNHAAELAATADRETAVHREDALDALRYAAAYQLGGGGNE